MKLLIFIIAYPLLWLLSVLPFRVLYAVSDVFYVLMYYLTGYRKKVVRANLKIAFPDKTPQELKTIEKKFYRHLCDLFLEMAKTMNISRKQIDKRFVFTNLDVYKDLEKKGKSIVVITSHYASYEWIISMNRYVDFKGFAIYKRINNPHFDNLVKRIRSRFEATLIDTKEVIDTMQENEKDNRLSVYGFASDQSPMAKKAFHWTSFFGVTVPAYTGAEMLAKRFDMNVVLLEVEKVKRGHYQATFEVMTEDARQIPDYEITDTFLRKLEDQIRRRPELYFWTHRRWKHRRDS